MIWFRSVQSRGFSLLEVLVTMLLGSLLLGTLIYNYLGFKRVYQLHDDLVVANTNIRLASFILWKNISQAGFSGCRRVSKRFGVYGYPSSIVSGSDVLVVFKAAADVGYLSRDIGVDTTSLTTSGGNKFTKYPLLLISDCKNSDLLLVDKHYKGSVTFKGKLQHSYQLEHAEIRGFEEVRFFIKDTKRVNGKGEQVYGLYFSINDGVKKELVSGVNGLRVKYGVVDGGLNGGLRYLRVDEVAQADLWDKVLVVAVTLNIQGVTAHKKHTLYVRIRARG